MANKKIFTGYTFEGGGQSKNLRLEAATSDPTNVGKGHAYYNTTAGTIKVSNADADATDSWKTLLTTGSSIAASQVDLSNVSATGLLTTSGSAARAYSEDKTGDTIVSRDGLGRIKVGTPASGDSDDYAASKGYVDSVAQGLDHKASVKFTTTGNISLSGTSAGNVDDTNSNAHAAGDRILVKDQDTASQNGIYIAASGNWTRATDADGSDLTEGAFVFVEDGTVNPNTSWVMTADNTWAQFSAAGQITAGDGLTKSGDSGTLSVNVAAPISIVSDNVTIADLAITGGKLANNTVTPTQLQDTGSFTMASLDIFRSGNYNGILKLNSDTDNYVSGIDFFRTRTGGNYVGGSIFLPTDTSSAKANLYIQAQSASVGHGVTGALTTNNGARIRLMGNDGGFIRTESSGFGIFPQSDIDSTIQGTLHVSTARYGSELASGNWTNSASSSLDFASISGASSTGFTGVWENGASNRAYIAVSGGFVVGKTYRIKFDYVIGSGSNVDLYQSDSTNAGQTHKIADLDGTTYDANYTPSNATDYIAITGTGGSGGVNFVLSNFSIKEDTLSNNANQTLSVNAAADDLVIANNTSTGLTIKSAKEASSNIYFADGSTDGHGRLYAHRYANGNSEIHFQASATGTLGNCLHLYGSDKSAKFEGGVGIGTAESNAGHITALDATPLITAKNSAEATYLAEIGAGSTGGKFYANGNAGAILLSTFGVSYFRGGNLEVDTRTDSNNASAELTVKSDVHASVVADRNADTNSANFMLRTAGYNKWRMSLGMAGSGNETFSIYDEANTANVLEIAQGGTQNHKANSIVNSATVAGLQDGACYDFDGTSGGIKLESMADVGTGDITFSAWIKSTQTNEGTIYRTNHSAPYVIVGITDSG